MTEEISGVIFGVWFLIGAALVFWMQAGFAMVEAGFTRASRDLTSLHLTKILTGQTLYSTWFSVRQQQLSYQELWLREQNLFPTVFIQELFQHLFIQSRLTGSGAAAGYPS